MKKINLLLGLLLLWSTVSFGATVTADKAKNVGYNYLVQNGTSLKSAHELQLIYTSGTAPVYFYVFGTDNSFVIVSADDVVKPILGYSGKNTFKGENMPSNLAYFLDGFNKQIDYAIKNSIAATAEIITNWNNLAQNKKPNAAKTTTVSPLLTTTWDQYPYYNALCPADAAAGSTGGRDVTGCVATAMAQVMKFWNWPTTGVGLNSYTTSSYGTLSANFAATTYNWTSMPASVSSSNIAVATLMYHCGVSVNMNYTPDESGAWVTEAEAPIANCAEYALKTYFNYKPTLHGEARASYSDATWISMLETDLNAGRPVICDGTGTSGGHCFVFDGYDATNKFHVNWGWSGVSNGYFTIDALNPSALGAGGGGGGFNSDQSAILGVQPNSGTVAASGLVLASIVNLSTSSIFYSQPFSVTAKVHNGGTAAFTGSYVALVFDATTGSLVDSIGVTAGSLAVGATSGLLTFSTTTGSLSMVPGNYTVSIYSKTSGSGWTLVGNGSYINSADMNVFNHNYLECASLMAPAAAFVQGSPASVDLNFENDNTADFTGTLEIDLFNLDGTYNSTIQSMTGMFLPALSVYTAPLTFTTSSITATPGTYLLAAFFDDGTSSTGGYICGADYYENPIYVTVSAPPPLPDIYEVNNTAATAYTLPLTWTANVSSKSTTGSNIHVATDQDYYKIVLAPGYNYSITARINDIVSHDDAGPYTLDASWSYSTDNGATWSASFGDVMTGAISLTGGAGGTVIFHVSPHFAGDIGTYLLKISNISRSPLSVPDVNISEAQVFPNPATNEVTADFAGTGATAIKVMLTDMQGRTVYSADVQGQAQVTVPVKGLAAGLYMLNVTTDAGLLQKKITVNGK